eukprot:7370406-Alexandrium_andersonii.AAC.1
MVRASVAPVPLRSCISWTAGDGPADVVEGGAAEGGAGPLGTPPCRSVEKTVLPDVGADGGLATR